MPQRGFVIAERYLLDSEIGAGATGLIWRATDLQERQQAAVKVLRSEYAGDPALLERLRAAVAAAGDIGHPGVAKAYDCGDDHASGIAYVVSELIDGPSLTEVVWSMALPASFIATALGQIAAALAAAHLAGLVHGDLKPSNILFTSEPAPTPVITDFGVTDAVNAILRDGNTSTAHGTGTVLYLAPERVSGALGTPASDLYSLGMIAYEWLTGAPSFTGTPPQVMTAHLRNPVPTLPRTVPERLAGLISQLTAKDPAQRPGDAGEVASALDDIANQLGSGDDDRLFPASAVWGGRPLSQTRAQQALSQPFSLFDEVATEAFDAYRARPWAGLAAHKREIAWGAGAVVLAGLIGWTASGPIQGAGKTAIPSGPQSVRPSPAPAATSPGLPNGVHSTPPASVPSVPSSHAGVPASPTSSPGATRTLPAPAPSSAATRSTPSGQPTVPASSPATPPPAPTTPPPSPPPSIPPTSSTPPPTQPPSVAAASPAPSPAATLLIAGPAASISLRVSVSLRVSET